MFGIPDLQFGIWYWSLVFSFDVLYNEYEIPQGADDGTVKIWDAAGLNARETEVRSSLAVQCFKLYTYLYN